MRSFAAILLIITFMVPFPAPSLELSLSTVIDGIVTTSSLIAVGRVTTTDPFNRFKTDRVSRVHIEDVLYGDPDAEDERLPVGWHDDYTYTGWGPICGAGPQLDEMAGKRKLWLLREVESRYVGTPIDLGKSSRDDLQYLAWIVEDPDRAREEGALLYRNPSLEKDDPDVARKREVFVTFLRAELKGMEAE